MHPPDRAGVAAASQTCETSVSSESPRESALSVSGSDPWSPYTEIPLPARNAGVRSLAAMAEARVRVLATRLSRKASAHFSAYGIQLPRTCVLEI